MRLRSLATLLGLVAAIGTSATGSARAQPAPEVRLDTGAWSRLYGGVEYLLWSLKGAPLSVPLLASGPDEEPTNGGFIRNSNVQVLYGAPRYPAVGGDAHQAFPLSSGGRLTLGAWLDPAHDMGVEASGFLLQQQSAGYLFRSDAGGNPPARIPLYNAQDYRAGGIGMVVGQLEDGVPVSLPGDLTGATAFKNTIQFWGAQAGASKALYRSGGLEVSGLAGMRYLNLTERFHLGLTLAGISGSEFFGQSGDLFDNIKTENQFIGPTLGARTQYTYGPWSAVLTTRIGLGLSHETEDITGGFHEYNTPSPAPPGMPGSGGTRTLVQGTNGMFAQPSNEGRRSVDKFAFVPEIQLQLGYQVTESLRLTVGYDFIYYSSVLRPTDQIDRTFGKGLVFQQDTSTTLGPSKRFRTSDFYAQGLNLGVAYRF